MTDGTSKQKSIPTAGLDLSQTTHRLSVADFVPTGATNDTGPEALLLSKSADARKWAPRWLAQNDIKTTVAKSYRDGLAQAREIMPDIIIVDAVLVSDTGQPLYQDLLDAADLKMPVFVMCSSNRELSSVVNQDPYDVIRKPFEWSLIARRIRNAIDARSLEHRLTENRAALDEAIAAAESAQKRLRRGESFEPVTGLPNKKKFTDLLRRNMASADRGDSSLAVIVVGFNRFRLVLEAMGQEQADLILTELGRILTDCMGRFEPSPSDTQRLRTTVVASIDHFRFAIMVTTSGQQDGIGSLQQQLLDSLARPIQVAGQTVSLSACLGVALYPHDADDVDSLLQRADNAMRDAQSRGGGFKYYCAETDAAAARKLKIENMLHEALDRDELQLAYQPITRVDNSSVIGAEALLRWPQADGSFISPAEFVPVAEECGLMNRIGEWVLDRACKQLYDWHKAGIKLPHICVNVAKVQLMNGDFVPTVKRTLQKYNVVSAALELELSERGVLSGDFDVVAQLEELKDLGVRLSIDDFGTGDSAIAYLRELPVDVLKIDRSYISDLTENEKDAALVSAIIALGQRLDLMVIAEGVETHEQLVALRELECDAFQGFLISQAVPGDAFVSLLKKP